MTAEPRGIPGISDAVTYQRIHCIGPAVGKPAVVPASVWGGHDGTGGDQVTKGVRRPLCATAITR